MMSRASLDAVMSRNTSSSAPCCVVALGQFHRIARVAQSDEVHALHHAAAGDIETGNNSLGQHRYSLNEIAHDLQSQRPRLLGMKLHAEDIVLLRAPPCNRHGVVAGRRRRRDQRRVVAVREIEIRMRRRYREAASTPHRGSISFQPMCGTRASPGKRRISPVEESQGRALPALLRSIRTAPASPGRSRETERPREFVRAALRAPASASSARIICPKCPTPGRMILVARCKPSLSRTSSYSAPISPSVFCTDRRFPAP